MAEPVTTAVTDTSAEIDRPRRASAATLLAHRWPALLAVAVSVPGFLDTPTPESVHALAGAMLLLPLWYVVIGALGRREWTWPVLAVGIGGFVLLRLQDRVDPVAALLAVGLLAVFWAAVRGRAGQPSFLLQVAGLVAYAALALASLALVPDVGRHVVAAGWFAHGLWDLAHLRADAGVARSGAEWCGVVDVVIAVQLVVLPLML